MVSPTGQPQPPHSLPENSRQAVQIPRHLVLAAARKIVSQTGDTEVAARRLINNATDHGIDFSLMFGVIEPVTTGTGKHTEIIRQVCLFVRGAGRTSLVFISEPPRQGEIGTFEAATADRSACLIAGTKYLKDACGDAVTVTQALPDPRDTWATAALIAAGFQKVGDLEYLRRPWRETKGIHPVEIDPSLARVVALSELPDEQHVPLLTQALEESYVETMDCPELCGMRTTADILDSHFATGEFLPELWSLVMVDDKPMGCMLFAPIAAQRTVELVYLGISKQLRGKGLSAQLLSMGMTQVRAHPLLQIGFEEFTCAVDTRNAPARKLYARAGFNAFANRIAFVKSL